MASQDTLIASDINATGQEVTGWTVACMVIATFVYIGLFIIFMMGLYGHAVEQGERVKNLFRRFVNIIHQIYDSDSRLSQYRGLDSLKKELNWYILTLLYLVCGNIIYMIIYFGTNQEKIGIPVIVLNSLADITRGMLFCFVTS